MTGKAANTQLVLTVPATVVGSLYQHERFHDERSAIDFTESAIAASGSFVDRNLAENDPDLVQIIAYGLLRHGNRILCVRRTKKTQRDVLRLKYTVLFGGHVDDVSSKTPVVDCVTREMSEELGIVPGMTPQLLGVVTDPTNAVGRLHLGLVFDVVHPTATIELSSSLDRGEFVGSRRNIVYEFLDWKELRSRENSFDPWSRLFLMSQKAERLLGASCITQRSFEWMDV